MRNIYCRISVVAIIVIAVLALAGCSGVPSVNAHNSSSSAIPAIQQISIDEAVKAWRNREAVFIDVRTAEEYKQGHVPGAILIPLSELEDRRSEIPTDKKIYLICRSGNRSSQANVILQKHGIMNTYSVIGGMLDWRGEVEK